MIRFWLFSFRAAVSCSALLLATGALAQTMPKVDLSIGLYRIQAEVAADEATRELGLMNRPTMPQQAGMLFVFDSAQRYCMWMKNTLLPLSVAFMDEQGKIINVEDMQPQTETSHCANSPARYALEMNLGWFKAKGVKTGTSVKGLDRAPTSH